MEKHDLFLFYKDGDGPLHIGTATVTFKTSRRGGTDTDLDYINFC